jgi:hypothetical protein
MSLSALLTKAAPTSESTGKGKGKGKGKEGKGRTVELDKELDAMFAQKVRSCLVLCSGCSECRITDTHSPSSSSCPNLRTDTSYSNTKAKEAQAPLLR